MKLVCCATLLAFALMVPAACGEAPRDRTPPSVPTGLRVVSVTEDSVTIAWNASTDNSGKIHAYVGRRASITRETARSRRSRDWCRTGR